MSANSQEFKFTDDLEREMIQREVDELNESAGNTAEPLLKWFLFAVTISVCTLFIVVFNSQ